MGEAVVGALVGATIQVLIENLISVSAKEIKLVRKFKEDLEKLQSNFDKIQNILYDANMQQVTSKTVKQWLKKIEDVAFKADNVLDEFNYQLLRKNNMENEGKMKKKVKFFFSRSNFRDRRLKLGLKIRAINRELELINQEAINISHQMGLVGAPAPGAACSGTFTGSETDSFTDDPIFIGRDYNVSIIVEKLTTIPSDQVFSILAVLGMGGLGKTTLTRKVFNNEKIKNHFGKCIWVHVSVKSDRVSLLKKILTTLKPDHQNVEAWSSEAVLTNLREDLAAKTYLLVLDDVWNQDRLEWDGFINSLSGITSVKGNGIIVTTRNEEVASIVQNTEVYKLDHLSEDSCWSIIKEKAFGKGFIPPDHLEKIGKKIAKRCQGLPLAAYVVGGVLRRRKSEDEWLSIEKNWLSDLEGDEKYISKILKLSFNDLSSPSLKKCFVYCSIFPKGDRIDTEELIELWMAEGFLQNDHKNDMETVGKNFLNLLLQNSLLQVVERDDYGNITYCSMHDLVHDLASSVLGSSKVNDSIYQVRYIGHIYDGDESSPIPKEQAKGLRTLFFKSEISEAMLLNFECLHVLTLRGNNVMELPSSIRNLIHLRYLDVSHTKIECLPESMGKLYHLQTLRYRGYYHHSRNCLRKLPSTLKYLINLRHLHIHYDVKLPPELGRLMSLQTLGYFKVEDKEGHRIEELGYLKNLKGKLEISNLENVRNKEDAKSAYLPQKPDLFKLTFRWSESRGGEAPNDENVLEGLQPHSKLKSLRIYGFKATNFPLWTSKMAAEVEGCWVGLNNLVKLELKDCTECKEIPMLGHLPHLKSLCLRSLTKVESIGSSFYGIDNCSSRNGVINVFPALKRLELRHMSNLKDWAEVEFSSAAENQPHEVKVFPCLEYLRVDHCRQLMSAPSHFPFLKELDISWVDSSSSFERICGTELSSLTKLEIGELDGLECLPSWLFHNNQNLSELKIWRCPKLRELPDDIHTLIALEELSIMWCPNLKSIPYSSGEQAQGFTSLRRLVINHCEGLINLPCEMIESCALSLESLSLTKLSCVVNLPMVIDCLQKMPRLAALVMYEVPQFISTSSMQIGNFRSLRVLSIGPSSDSSDCESFKKTVDWILEGSSHSLYELNLLGMEHWDSLPDQLQYLTALSHLELYNFGIEALPEWFWNLSSLETLDLLWCEKLRHIPSKEAMQRQLAKLTELRISNCPLLEQR